jgi:DNA-binding MarR family transcriptional regulator
MANTAPDDSELEQLLTQLLRQLSPAFIADTTGSGSGTVRRQAGVAAKSARDQAGRNGSAPGSRVAGGSVPGGDAEADGARIADGDGMPGVPAMSASEARALIELVSARGIAQGELAAVLRLDKSTVSRLAAGLERKGWVRRGRDEDNQRYVRLYLTPEGAQMASRVWQAWHSRQARILAALSNDERAGLIAGLGGLVRGLAAEGLPHVATVTGGTGRVD